MIWLRSLFTGNGLLVAALAGLLAMYGYHKLTVRVAFEKGSTAGATAAVKRQEAADATAKSTVQRVRARVSRRAAHGVRDPYTLDE